MIFAPMIVNVGGLKVNVLDHGSLLNTGPNQFLDHFISYKRNQGYGEQNGDFVPMIIPISYILDSDLNDSNAVKNSIL
ncbi:MAG: hypothetical protein ABGX20_11920 [Bacillus sp. (in: firmicutes)]|nr:hypothetical protein [Bacillus sp. SORGH_AS_0510]MDQ1145957.1 hypothetical protein [Bacillus sp. SORGH_AS_0510]